ncbi:Modification methylase DpnIIA [Oligella sp. MSHR50489EDL]|uniref:DNA adenine methylase n=1 Tax=Oligella sp. MSHR50489EDL TaxID=3139409 RepID=UPI003D8155E2
MAVPIIAWLGGKRRLAKTLLPLFPDHQCYVEPFCGAAALYFMKAPAKSEIINDINGDLINLFRVVKHHPEALVKEFQNALCSRELFECLKNTPSKLLTDIQRAARFYYLQKLAFGGRITNPTLGTATASPPRLNLNSLQKDISQAHERLKRTLIEHDDWYTVMLKYDRSHTFYYLDPPYYELTGYGVKFDFSQYKKMADFMANCKGKVLLSLNDHPAIVEVFNDFSIDRIDIAYTVGGQTNEPRRSTELIIKNY